MTPDAVGGFVEASASDRAAIEVRLGELIGALASHHAPVEDSIRYMLLGGGKRLRPLLCLWAHDLVEGNARDAALDAACAVECIHTYSLVHDDLPCMDDDDLRRGRPSCHRRFGEAVAVLTGDALQALAFGVLSTIPARHPDVPAPLALSAVEALARASGTAGLITGQALDLEGEGRTDAGLRDVERIHDNKTARLISAAMELGSILGGAGSGARAEVAKAGMLAGRAFQIVDDILDLETDEETLGKTPGKDVKEGKLTYTAIAGVDGARLEARRLIDEAAEKLPRGPSAAPLRAVFGYFVDRVS